MNILMTTNGMEIGGAETHILELSAELKRLGHSVTVASAGGVYTKQLEAMGIEHVYAPLAKGDIFSVVKSYAVLKKLMKNRRFDIVHAHARIPAFLCGLLKRKYKFNFVTSAHWVFRVTPLYRLIANWGERTVAVSEDIKKYLIDNYGENPDNISVTINGIDTEKFSPDSDAGELARELQLDSAAKTIVYVSRMDKDRSAVAFMLTEAIERLGREDLQAVIVGGGNDYERLKKAAEDTNKRLGRRAVVTTGARVDINKCVALGDYFVGVSRAALEAMAAQKPVIIAGNEGYIGIFSEETYPVSLETNFCCRGCQPSTTDLLVKDLTYLLENDTGEIGRYNRDMIIKNYSVARMTADYLDAYNDLLSHSSKGIMISGYYGYKNSGDDAVLKVILDNIKERYPALKITVLSKNPKETKNTFNVDSVNRFNVVSVNRRMKNCSLLISGGGSLFQDVTSTKSLLYYTLIVRMAHRNKLRIMIYANGIGPVNEEKNRLRTKAALARADVITLRDEASLDEINSLGISGENITVTADPAFSIKAADDESVRRIFEAEQLDFDKKYVAISVREWKKNCDDFEEIIERVCVYLKSCGAEPLFIPMQSTKDYEISRRIAAATGSALLKGSYNVYELMGLMTRMEFVIGMRLHTLIYALNCKVPVIGLSYDPKIDAVLNYAGCENRHRVAALDYHTLKDDIDEILGERAEFVERISPKIDRLRANTEKDALLAADLIMARI